MRWIRLMLTTVLLGACASAFSSGRPAVTATPTAPQTGNGTRSNLPDLGAAPELTNDVWLNTDRPLRLADLRGEVVVLDMWTFDCINCRNVIPALRDWYDKYHTQGLVVIGNHYPEFNFERDLNNLKDAIQRLNVPYAVAQDNNGRTWNAYRTR